MDPVDRIRPILAEYTEVSPTIITTTTTMEELDLDSLELVDLVVQLEDKFGIELLDETIDFETVGEYADLIAKKLENNDA